MEGMWLIPPLSFPTSLEGHGWHSANTVWNSIVLYLPLQLPSAETSALENSHSASRKQSKDKVLWAGSFPPHSIWRKQDELLPCHWPLAKRRKSDVTLYPNLPWFSVSARPALSGTEVTLPCWPQGFRQYSAQQLEPSLSVRRVSLPAPGTDHVPIKM